MDYCLSYDSSTGGVSLRAVGDVYEVSDVTSDVKWNIYFHNGGYVFQHYDHSSHTMYPASSGTAAGTSITTGTYAGSNSTFRWTLENGGSPMGALLHDTANGTLANQSTVRYVACGQTVSPAQLNLYASYYADGEYCFEPNWLSSNPNVASVNIRTGQVTAHAPGTATITLSMMEDYSGEEFICRYTLVVTTAMYDYVVNIEYGQTKTTEQLGLTDFINQANPSGQALTWHSSNEDVAVINNTSTGTVRADDYGETTITATASNSTILAYTLVVPETIYYITNFYDSTAASDTTYISNIETAINFLNTAYYKQFGGNGNYFAFMMKGYPIRDAHDRFEEYNPLEACDLAAAEDNDGNGTPDGVCYCESSPHDAHHNRLDKISDHFINKDIHPREQNEIIVYWTKRDSSTFCKVSNGNHTNEVENRLAIVINKRPVIQIITPYGNSYSERIQSMGNLLVHEMAHVFLLGDQEGDDHKPTKAEDGSYPYPSCIMQKYESIYCAEENNGMGFHQAVLDGSDLAFCETCAKAILQNWRNIESSTAWNDGLYSSLEGTL